MLRKIIRPIFVFACVVLCSGDLHKWEYFKTPRCSYLQDTWDWAQSLENFTNFDQSKFTDDPHRLRRYIAAYESSVTNFKENLPNNTLFYGFGRDEKEHEVLQDEFITNELGEFTLNYEISGKLRRVETGAFEKGVNGAVFAIRGFFYSPGALVTYKLDETGLYTQGRHGFEHAYVESAAKAILCACCAQYATCSSSCDAAAPVYEECPSKVSPDENLPKVMQWAEVKGNGTYEWRMLFGKNFHGRSELYQFSKVLDDHAVFGFFPDPEDPQKDLPYFFQLGLGRLYVGFEEFPGLNPCLPLASIPSFEYDYSSINNDLLKGLVG